MAYSQGIALPYGQRLATPDDYLRIAINYFPNRVPLITRLSRRPVGAMAVKLVGCDYRPRAGTLGGAVADGSTTTITLTDATFVLLGDILKIESEYVEVTADPNTTNNQITVRRGVSGTTGAAHSNGVAFTLIGNSRTGGEVNQKAITFQPSPTTQYPQTFQHPYEIGGATQSLSNLALPPGIATPLERERMLSMQQCLDDMEFTSYYGKSEALSGSVTRQKQAGIQQILTTNNTSSPTNASAYKPSDLVRDTMQKCFNGGGQPNTLFVSTDFLSAFATWGYPAQMLDAGATAYGTRIELFYTSFLPTLVIVPSPLMAAGTAFCFNSEEVAWGEKRRINDQERGRAGDAIQGDVIAEGCVLIENEKHHAWVEGITGWAKQS